MRIDGIVLYEEQERASKATEVGQAPSDPILFPLAGGRCRRGLDINSRRTAATGRGSLPIPSSLTVVVIAHRRLLCTSGHPDVLLSNSLGSTPVPILVTQNIDCVG